MKTLFSKITLLLALLSLSVNAAWGQVTVEGTITATATLGGVSQYVVMAYTGEEKHTSYRAWEGISRSDVVSRSGSAPAGALYIELKRQGGTVWVDQKAKVEVSVDNSNWTDVSGELTVNNTSYKWFGPYAISQDAKYVRIISTNGVKDKYFRKVYMTMASYCQFENTNTLNFGSNVYMTPNELTKKIIWSNISNKDITITGTDKDRFSISLTKVGCSAGKWGNTIVTVTYKRDKYDGGREHTATLNVNGNSITLKGTTTVATPLIECATASAIPYQSAISGSDLTPGTAKHPTRDLTIDGNWTWQNGSLEADAYKTYTVVFTPDAKYGGGYSAKNCTISIPIIKRDQTIDWPLADATTNPATEYATGQLMGATATSGLDVAYESSNRGWGYINENGRLVVVVPNKEITISANQGGNDNWNEAPERTITFTTKGANPNQTTEVTASGITYGDLLSVSKLSGKVYLDGVVVPGTLSWVDPSIMPNAGTANHMVLFTPDNTDAYSSIYFEVPVTVAKATPVITWNIGSILREEVRYDHFVTSSNKEKDFSISVSNATLLNVSGTTLRTESVDNRVTRLTITLTQEASDNYNRKTETKTVAIYPKSESCLPYDPMTGDDFNDKSIAGKDGSVEWCNTNEDGHDTYALVPVTYTQRVGIMLGNWKGGGNYSEKSVTLFFSGIPNQISFDYEVQVVSSPGIPWPATDITWILEESADGENYTELVHYLSVLGRDYKSGNITHSLSENTRYVRITYGGNFAGFIKNLRITRKQYIRSDKSSLLFGTDSPLNPLQEPQAITLSYSSLGVCGGSTEDAITVTSSNPAFYVDEETITENVGIEQKGSYTIRVRCNNVNQEGMLTCTSNDGTTLSIPVRSTNPPISTAATDIFQTGTEHNPVSGTAYRAQQTLMSEETGILAGLFNGSTPLFDELYIYGVSESAADSREWKYSPAKGYKVPVVNASNVHTPCFVYKKDGAQYTHVRTIDAATATVNITDSKAVFVGYRPEGPAATALQLGTGAVVNLNNTEIVSTGVAIHVNGDTATIAARGKNTVTSASNAAVQLSGAATLGIVDNWKSGEASAVLALRPDAGYPSIDLGSASGRVYINGTQLELHNGTHMAIAHMEDGEEQFDGEVHITDGSIGGEEILGMPKLTFIDGGTFNDGTVNAYTLKGVAKRPRNSHGEMVSRHTMAPAALAADYSWYGQNHLTPDGSAKVNPMLMDEEVWIFTGDAGVGSDVEGSWNKGAGLPTENDDVLINAPMVVSGGEMKVKSLTINWEDKGKGIPAVTVNPDGGLTVGEGGIDGIKVNMVNNLALKAGAEGATKGQTGFLRIHPNSAEPMPEATVQLYSIGYYDKSSADTDENNVAAWQYVGTPIDFKGALAKTVFTRSWIYSYDESSDSWVNNRKNLVMQPFVGYATTQYDSKAGKLLEYKGELIPNTGTHTINLKYSASNGYNVVANSFAAPIDITKMRGTDFVNVADPTIYLFHTGTHKQAEDNLGTEGSSAGQFISIAIGTAAEMAMLFADDDIPTTIAPMQGFGVYASGSGGQVNLDYSKLVWNANYAEHPNKPLRAPQLHEEETDSIEEVEITGALKMTISVEGRSDKCYLLESESYDALYEAGYDASKKMSGRLNVFTVAEDKQLAVNATNSIEGTRVGVRTGEETMYTMFFSHLNSEKELALLDWETEQITEITENAEYTFFAEPNSMITDRFEIIEWDGSNKPGIATGVENVENGTKVHKFIKDNQLFILKNGVLYNATGVLVR